MTLSSNFIQKTNSIHLIIQSQYANKKYTHAHNSEDKSHHSSYNQLIMINCQYLSQYNSQDDREVNSAVDLSCFADHLESINVSTALEPFIPQHNNSNHVTATIQVKSCWPTVNN